MDTKDTKKKGHAAHHKADAEKKKLSKVESDNTKDSAKPKEGAAAGKDSKDKGDNKDSNRPPQKPDKEVFDKKIEEVKKKIDKKHEQIAKIIEKIDLKSSDNSSAGANGGGSKERYDTERKNLFDQQAGLKQQKSTLIEQRKAIWDAENKEKKDRRDKENQLKSMEKGEGKGGGKGNGSGKSDINMLNEEEIDNHIQLLDMRINMGFYGADIKAEKKAMMEIQRMKMAKPKARKHTEELVKLRNETESASSTNPNNPSHHQSSLIQINTKLDDLKLQQDQISKQLDALKLQKDERMKTIQPLIDERGTLRDELSLLMDEKSGIFEEKKKKMDLWKEWMDKRKEEMESRYLAEQEAYERMLEGERLEKELEKVCPYVDEKVLLEQTIDYCKAQLPQSAIKKVHQEEIQHDLPQNTHVLTSKKDRSADMWINASKGKKGGKKAEMLAHDLSGHGHQDSQSQAAQQKQLQLKNEKRIKHTADSLSIYKKLNVSTPMFVGDFVGVIRELEGKMDDVMGDMKKWERDMDKKRDEVKKRKLELVAGEVGEVGEVEKKELGKDKDLGKDGKDSKDGKDKDKDVSKPDKKDHKKDDHHKKKH